MAGNVSSGPSGRQPRLPMTRSENWLGYEGETPCRKGGWERRFVKSAYDTGRTSRACPVALTSRNRHAGWAVFVHGCFWHRHPGCRRATTPSTRTDYWLPKLAGNVAREQRECRKPAEFGPQGASHLGMRNQERSLHPARPGLRVDLLGLIDHRHRTRVEQDASRSNFECYSYLIGRHRSRPARAPARSQPASSKPLARPAAVERLIGDAGGVLLHRLVSVVWLICRLRPSVR